MRVLLLSFLMITGNASYSFAQTAQTGTAALSTDEFQFYTLINQFRQILKLPQLSLNDALETSARNHSLWMDAVNILTHYETPTRINSITPFQRMSGQGYAKYTFAGENIACGNGTAVDTFRQWAFSPGHLQNMVNPHYHDTGIARAGTGKESCPYYWTNDFGSLIDIEKDPPGTTDLAIISQAIVAVSGAIPPGTIVSLTEPTSAPEANQSPSDSAIQATYNLLASGSFTVAQQVAPENSLTCLVPYGIGKDILTHYENNDTLVQATKNADGSYHLVLSYFLNGTPSSVSSIAYDGVTMIRNADYPLLTLVSPDESLTGAFTIQYDSTANKAEFDSSGIEPGVTGSIRCTGN